MPKKRTDNFQLMTIEQQQEVIERFKSRKNVRDANRDLAKLVLAWVIDQPIDTHKFLEIFHANGHAGEYHEVPKDTTQARVIPQAAELPNIIKRLADTPLDYMGAVELSYVYLRIQQMIALLASLPRGTPQQAIDLYKLVGENIRQKVYTETGHYPEEFPVPYGRMTGDESAKQFTLSDHQPKLFEEE